MELTTPNPYSIISNFTIAFSPLAESLHGWILLVCGLVSIVLSLFMITLIVYQTPNSSKRYRMGLIALQICFTVFDAHVCCLFSPIMPLPFFAGYCTGFLCTTVGLSFHGQFIVMFVVALETFACFFICMLQRHQKLLPPFSGLKLSKFAFSLAINLAVIVSAAGPLAFATAELSADETLKRIQANPKMAWLTEKPGFVVYSINLRPHMLYIFGYISLNIIILSLLCVILMAHTSYFIHKTTCRSRNSKKRAVKAMSNLFMQFVAYFLVILIPVLLMLSRAYFTINSQLLFFAALTIFCVHGVVCTSVALLMNSTFRMLLMAPFRRNQRKHSMTIAG